MRRDRDRIRLDPDVGHRGVRQVQRQRLPPIPVVVRHVEAVLRARVEQPATRGIFAHGMHVIVRADAVHDLRPRLSRITRAEDVSREVVQQGFLHRDVRAA